MNGDEISFSRQVIPIDVGSHGGDDLYGASAPLQFVARRITTDRFRFKGVEVDLSAVRSLPDLGSVLNGLRRQIDIVDAAIIDPSQKAFLESVPLVISPSPDAASDNASYSAATRTVLLLSRQYDPEHPVVLHELMHAYQDQELPGGFGNPEVLKLYAEARAGGQFPAGSYMLSTPGEYFAMMASVYLHGSAARDPFTRKAIKEKQSDCYQWLVKQFGLR